MHPVQAISIHALREEGDEQAAKLIRDAMNFYPRPPRGGRLQRLSKNAACDQISIHALREEGDSPRTMPRLPAFGISIHALREEGDAWDKSQVAIYKRFLSTPSARRATRVVQLHGLLCRNFYPRPPRGGRREGGRMSCLSCGFLSTPSARRATELDWGEEGEVFISIHALREEGD